MKIKTLLVTLLSSLASFALLASPAQAFLPEVQLGSERVKLEVASTDAEVQRGLMYRTNLPETQGMIFVFSPPREVAFWMAHCFIHLDMIFIKDGKIVEISKNVPPCKAKNDQDCPRYPEAGAIDVSHVIEVAGGYCDRHGVKVGDTVKVEAGVK